MVYRILHRKNYPSDLTDEQWAILAPLIPPAKQSNRGGRPRTVDMREVLNTLFYLNRSGCQWDMLPHDLLPKSTVYDYFAQWRDDGTWTKMVQALRERTRVAAHLRECPACRERVDAEASARQMLHAHAAAARTTLRPRVLNLGRPMWPA